jgi:hypothetical protein
MDTAPQFVTNFGTWHGPPICHKFWDMDTAPQFVTNVAYSLCCRMNGVRLLEGT